MQQSQKTNLNYQNQFPEVDRKKIVDFAHNCLSNKDGEEALFYLKKDRGLSDSIISQFKIGFFPSYMKHQLRGRIITPIYDVYGNLIAISTRHIDKNHKSRFWHEHYDKKFHLYGLSFAKKNIIKYNKAILVEGEMDVCYLHSHGINIAVGVSGSAFSVFQASLLSRYCSEVYVVFDADDGGRKGVSRLLKMYHDNNLDKFGLKYISVSLPEKNDPDDYVKNNGINKFINILKEAKEDEKYL